MSVFLGALGVFLIFTGIAFLKVFTIWTIGAYSMGVGIVCLFVSYNWDRMGKENEENENEL